MGSSGVKKNPPSSHEAKLSVFVLKFWHEPANSSALSHAFDLPEARSPSSAQTVAERLGFHMSATSAPGTTRGGVVASLQAPMLPGVRNDISMSAHTFIRAASFAAAKIRAA